MSNPQRHQTVITDTNLTPVVQIITWVTLTASVITFVAHAGINIYITRALSLEIGVVFTSVVFSVGQSIAVSVQTLNGFGKPYSSLSENVRTQEQKAEYASVILFFFALALSKLSITAFIWNLTPSKRHHTVILALCATILLWLVSAVLVASLQCSLPHPWDSSNSKCINRTHWWYATSILSIATEIGLVGLEFAIIVPLSMKTLRKATILSIFSCRLLVTIATGIQLYFFHLDITGPRKDDRTLGYWRSTMTNQIVVCLAVVTTSLPYAKILMESLETGMMRNDDLRRRGNDYSSGSNYIKGQRLSSHPADSGGTGYLLLDVSKSAKSASASSTGGDSTMKLRGDEAESKATAVKVMEVPGAAGRVGGVRGIQETRSWAVERD